MPLPEFATVDSLWKSYSRKFLATVEPTDIRHHLAAEVSARLRQLDLALEYSAECERRIRPDRAHAPEEGRAFLHLWSKLQAGPISMEEYVAQLPTLSSSRMDPCAFMDAFDRLRLFAEMFYFVAWRLRQIVNSKPPRHFPYVAKLATPGLVLVRNHLVEHPEHGKEHARYEQHFVLTDSGLVLKTSEVLIREGNSMAAREHSDQGLYRNAEELHAELTRALNQALEIIPRDGADEA
jgi:hypothetical protein